MALFQQYAQPGVYTSVAVEEAGLSLFGDVRVPVLIGEGQETRVRTNIEMHRGSSSVVDDRKVQENVSDQITGFNREFMLSCHPVVKGDGKGTLTNDPKDIRVTADGIPVLVSHLNGETGKFLTQQMFPLGTNLRVDYFFKRQDTLIANEDLSEQVPVYARFNRQPGLDISLSIPGVSGNKVSLAFTQATTVADTKSDSQAVSGIGTDVISIEICKPVVAGGVTQIGYRTIQEILNLIETGIPTQSGGYLTAKLNGTQPANTIALAVAAEAFKGGNGPNTNRHFKLANVPVVDGTHGGITTNNPKHVTVTVNAAKVDVQMLDGAHGLITLTNAVPEGAVVRVTYFTNRFQDTWDDLPNDNVCKVNRVGFAPDRTDFIEGIDFTLFDNKIHWGAAAVAATGQATAGYIPFDASVVPMTLVDEFVYLRPCTGVANGSNAEFQLEDVPVTGSQLSHVTDNPADIKVYAGATPAQALANGPLRVIRLSGASRTFTLYTPPMPGTRLFASYNRNCLNDHTYTLEVVNAGIPGQGTYTVEDENGNAVPSVTVDVNASSVMDANYTTTGIVWPHSHSDLKGVPGQSPEETITITFQDDDLNQILQPSVQAYNDTAQPGLRFTATTPGQTPNGVTKIQFVSGTATDDTAAIKVEGEEITVYITDASNNARTLQQVLDLFTTQNITTPNAGRITCSVVGTPVMSTLAVDTTPQMVATFSNGANALLLPYSQRFKVSSNRTAAEAAKDGRGRTGGATTDPAAVPAHDNDTPGNDGFLGQTYIDRDTGVSFTICDPNAALAYGYTSLPSPSYQFRPGDRIVLKVSNNTPFKTGKAPQISIPGLRFQVNTTAGMFPTDTLLIHTFNKAGKEPKVGEFYYTSYETEKIAADYGLKMFTNLSDVYAEYGEPLPTNRLSLAAKLMMQNCGQGTVFCCVQVPKATGLESASDQTFMEAISNLSRPLPGSDRKVDVIVPLTTSPVVQQFLAKHLNTEATPRKRGEAICFLGMGFTADAAESRALARGISSERVVLLYPGGAILSIDVNGSPAEFAVDGSFLAAAMCGMYINPANDVATTLTRQKMVGFDRLVRRLEDPILDLMAADGVCILTESEGAFKVRHYISTRTDNPLTREITSTTITDFVRQRSRKVLAQFVGRKNLQNVLNDIAIVQHSLMKSLIGQEIIEAYGSLEVLKDEADPTVVHVKVAFKPVFSLLWVDVNFRVRTRA